MANLKRTIMYQSLKRLHFQYLPKSLQLEGLSHITRTSQCLESEHAEYMHLHLYKHLAVALSYRVTHNDSNRVFITYEAEQKGRDRESRKYATLDDNVKETVRKSEWEK